MGISEYMTPDTNGNVVINYNNMPEKVFVDAIQTKEIAYAKIMSKQDKINSNFKNGEPDVILIMPSGNKKRITRKQLYKDYKHSSGKNIALAVLKTGKKYLVYRYCNDNIKVFKVPTNCIIDVNGNKVNSNYYLVCKTNESGCIDKNSTELIPCNIFRKQFKIPMQAVIKRHIDSGRNSSSIKLFDRTRRNMISRNTRTREINTNQNIINNRQTENQRPVSNTNRFSCNRGVNTFRNNNQPQQKDEAIRYKYTVTQKVVDTNNKLLGFTLKEIDTGRTKNVTSQELSIFCRNKLVNNVMLVRNQKGTLYLKGNGCSLDTLPQVII